MNLSRWKCVPETQLLGHVRDFQFVSPIKGAFSNWGVPHTECLQSHRCARVPPSLHHLTPAPPVGFSPPDGATARVATAWPGAGSGALPATTWCLSPPKP